MQTHHRSRAFASASLLALALAGTAHAQAPSNEVEQVIVTAQRREATVQDVPASLTAISGDDIERQGLSRVEDLVAQTTGLQFGQGYGTANAFIRGVGLNEPSGSTSPGVAVYVDGVYQPHGALASLAQTDLARIELLRGPQGTLYGRNATAGAINFVAQAPTAETGGFLSAGVETYDTFNATTQANVAWSDRLRSRIGVTYRDQEKGYIKNVAGGPDLGGGRALSGRFTTVADLTEDLALKAVAYGATGSDYAYNVFFAPLGATTLANNPALQTAIQAPRPWRTAANRGPALESDLGGVSATATWDHDAIKVTSLTSYQRYRFRYVDLDSDATNVDYVASTLRQDVKTFQQQLDLAAEIGPMSWLAGAYYMEDDHKIFSRIAFPIGTILSPRPAFFGLGPGGAFVADYRNVTETYAAYADVTASLSDSLRLIAGVRRSHDDIKVTQTIVSTNLDLGLGFVIPRAVSCENAVYRPEFTSTTWRAGAQYTPDDSLNVYGTVSRGFKSGGVNIGLCGNSYAPEKVTSYEAGLKRQALGGRLSFSAAAFYYDYTDLQIFQFETGKTTLVNAPKAEVLGAEFESRFQVDDHWTLNASATFLRTRYGSFLTLDNNAPGAPPVDVKGNRLNYSPPYEVNLGAEYATDQLDWGQLTGRVDVSFNGKTYFRPFNLPGDAQSAYQIVNASLIWDSPDRATSVRIYARNLFDEAHISVLSSGFGSSQGTWAPPRTVGVALSHRF